MHSIALRFAWRQQISYSVDFESFGSYCSQASQDDAVNQKETLVNEVKCLRGELQQVRDDRDHQVSQVQALSAEMVKYKETTGKSFAELDNLTMKSKSLEVGWFYFLQLVKSWQPFLHARFLLQETCSYQREQIRILELQLAAANDKLRVPMTLLKI